MGVLRKILENIQDIRVQLQAGGGPFTELSVREPHAQIRELLAHKSSKNIDPGLSALIARFLGAASREEEYVAILAELDHKIQELEDAEINAGVEGGVYPYRNLVAPFDIGDLRDLLIKIMKSTTSSQRSVALRLGLFGLMAPCKAAVEKIPDKVPREYAYTICVLLDHYNGNPVQSIPDIVIGFFELLASYETAGQFLAELRRIAFAPLRPYTSSTLGEILNGYLSPLYTFLSEPRMVAYLQALPPSTKKDSIYLRHNILFNFAKYLRMTIYELLDELLTQLSPYVSSRGGPVPDALYYKLTDIRLSLSNDTGLTPEHIDYLGREVLAFLRHLPPKYTTVAVTAALRHPLHFADLADLQDFARPLQISLARIIPDFRHNRDVRGAVAAAGDNLPRKRRVANAELYEENLGAAASRNNVGNLPLPLAAAAGGRGRIRRGVVEDEEELEPPAPLGVKILKEANLNGELSNFNLANNSGAAAKTAP